MYAYICVYEWLAYRRKLYVERVSFQCVCMEDNEIDKPWSSLKHCVFQESDLNRRVWLAQGGSVKITNEERSRACFSQSRRVVGKREFVG